MPSVDTVLDRIGPTFVNHGHLEKTKRCLHCIKIVTLLVQLELIVATVYVCSTGEFVYHVINEKHHAAIPDCDGIELLTILNKV